MRSWNDIYAGGSIHIKPSKEVAVLVSRLKADNVIDVLDAGCGTGRHSLYLAEMGFNVHGVDISERAIQIAESNRNGKTLDYRVAKLAQLPYADSSMDFILANHSLEYGTYGNVVKCANEFSRVLRRGRSLFLRVASTQHPFYHASPKDVYGFSHIGFCIQNSLPVHFFSEDELRQLFKNYMIERLEHVSHELDHDKISVPLREWILLCYKQ